jgi:hypothetical protein
VSVPDLSVARHRLDTRHSKTAINSIIAIGDARITTMATENSESVGPPMPIDPTALESANWWYDFSSRWLLVVGGVAAASACATVALAFIQWRSDTVRERYSSWRTATLELQTQDARKETARLASEAEKARQKAAPRSLSKEQQDDLVGKISSFRGTKFAGLVAGSVADAWPLWILLDNTLRSAGWERVAPAGLAAGDPPAGVAIAPASGVTVIVPKESASELAPIAVVLAVALNEAGIAAAVAQSTGPQSRPGIIVVEIGPKPQ